MPPGTEGVPNSVISSSAYNTFLQDLVDNALNATWPISIGGTGGTSAITGWDGLATKGTDIASGASINLQTATGPSITITGTATISTVTLNEGKFRLVRAGGAFTLDASASLLVNGSSTTDLTVTAEDLLLFRGGASSVVSVARLGSATVSTASTTDVLTGTDTTKAVTSDSLAALWEKGSDEASAGTVSFGEGGFFHITGTTTITDIDWDVAKNGRRVWAVFDGILTLTHNATTLQLPGGASITTAAGDRALFVQDASDNVICLDYVRATGVPIVTVPVAQGGTGTTTLTSNNVILGNGTSAVQFVAPSTSGNVLTSNGTTWQSTAPSSGSMTLIGTLTTTSGTTQSLTNIPAGYRELYCEIEGVSFNAAVTMTIATSSTNGAAYGTAGNITLTTGSAAGTLYGIVTVLGISSTVANGKTASSSVSIDSGTDKSVGNVICPSNTAAVVDAIRFAGGTFDAGTIRVYGVK